MKPSADNQIDMMMKILTDTRADSETAGSDPLEPKVELPPQLSTSPETAADDLVKLVLAIIDTLRQVMERQAIRRVESGSLAEDEIERLGLTLMQLESRMVELKAHFGLTSEDLNLNFGTVQELKNILDEGA